MSVKKGSLNLLIVVVFVAAIAVVLLWDRPTKSAPAYPAASQSQVEAIRFGLEDGLTTGATASVKSNDFRNIYFVAAELLGPGLDGAVGVWAMNDNADSMIFSVDAIADEFSGYPRGSRTQAGISMADDGASEVKQYIRQVIADR